MTRTSITNRLFDETPANWICFVCGRSKSEIMRTTQSGCSVGKIVTHHDHLCDLPNEVFRKQYGSDWNFKLQTTHPGLGDFLNRIEDFVRGFRNERICEDCNNAEATAKRAVNADDFFSFPLLTIRRFIQVHPCTKHQVDENAAAEAHKNMLPWYELRKNFATELIERALNGEYWVNER